MTRDTTMPPVEPLPPMNTEELLEELTILVDGHFPKGKSKERGRALVLIAGIVRLARDEGWVEP